MIREPLTSRMSFASILTGSFSTYHPGPTSTERVSFSVFSARWIPYPFPPGEANLLHADHFAFDRLHGLWVVLRLPLHPAARMMRKRREWLLLPPWTSRFRTSHPSWSPPSFISFLDTVFHGNGEPPVEGVPRSRSAFRPCLPRDQDGPHAGDVSSSASPSPPGTPGRPGPPRSATLPPTSVSGAMFRPLMHGVQRRSFPPCPK